MRTSAQPHALCATNSFMHFSISLRLTIPFSALMHPHSRVATGVVRLCGGPLRQPKVWYLPSLLSLSLPPLLVFHLILTLLPPAQPTREVSFVILSHPRFSQVEDIVTGLDYAFPDSRKIGGCARVMVCLEFEPA